jgi:hypothetical protein
VLLSFSKQLQMALWDQATAAMARAAGGSSHFSAVVIVRIFIWSLSCHWVRNGKQQVDRSELQSWWRRHLKALAALTLTLKQPFRPTYRLHHRCRKLNRC